MSPVEITENELEALRREVGRLLSPERLTHTLGVEQTAADMAELYCPEKKAEIRAAALLHDVTKELAISDQLEILRANGVAEDEYIKSPATLHSVTAALIIPEKYPQYATETVISSVRYHTTGRENMTLAEKIIYLADYIEPNRKHDVCQKLRAEFFAEDIEKMAQKERLYHLDGVILKSLCGTVEHIESRGGYVCGDTLRAKQYIENNRNY